MSRSRGCLFACAWLLLLPAAATAQGRDALVAATVHFIQAAEGEFGDEGRYLTSALGEMERSLAAWDAALARTAAALAAEAGAASPAAAARIRTALAAACLERGRFGDALEQLEQATQLAPVFADAHLLKGLVLERLGRNDAAAAAYRAALQSRGENLAAAYLVAVAPIRSDADRAAGTAAVSELLAAVAMADARRLELPTDTFLDDASSPTPLLPLARYASGFALIRQAKYGDALAALRSAAASDPLVTASPPELVGAAGALRAGDVAGAIERASAVLDGRAGSGQAHRVLGRAYEMSGDAAQAVEQLREAVRLDPGDERSRLGLSRALAGEGRIAEARVVLVETVERLPASGRARWRLGELAVRDGDRSAALAAFDAAAALGPLAGAGALQARRASLFTQQGDLEAVRAHRARVAAVPHDSGAHLDLGRAYTAAGRHDEALVEYLAAVVLEPKRREARTVLGEALTRAGRLEAAAAQKTILEGQ